MTVFNCGPSTAVGLCASCAAACQDMNESQHREKQQGFYPMKASTPETILPVQPRRLRLLAAADVCVEEGFLEVAGQLRRIANQ